MLANWLRTGGMIAVAVCLAACAPTVEQAKGPTDTPEHHYAAGQKFVEQAKYADALVEFERARALAPKYAPAYEGIALAQLGLGQADKALEAAEKVKDLAPRYVPGYIAAGRVKMAKGDLKAALKEFDEAIALDGKSAPAVYYRGEAYLRGFEFAQAERDFDRALQLNPQYAAARREWERSMKIRMAAPGTAIGKKIALAEPITRADLAALIATELGLEEKLRSRRPELFDPSYRPPQSSFTLRPPASPAMTDMDGHWAKGYVELVTKLQLMQPFPDHTFRPGEPVDRATYALTVQEIIAVATNDDGIRRKFIGGVTPFPDVRSDHFAFNAAMISTTRGILEAEKKSGAFRMADPVSGPDALLSLRKLAELF